MLVDGCVHSLHSAPCTNVQGLLNGNELNLAGNTLDSFGCVIESDGRYASITVQSHLPRWTSAQSGITVNHYPGIENTLTLSYETEGSSIVMTCCTVTEATHKDISWIT